MSEETENSWIEFQIHPNHLGGCYIQMTGRGIGWSLFDGGIPIAYFDTEYRSVAEAETSLKEIYRDLQNGLSLGKWGFSGPGPVIPEPDVEDPLWLISKDNPDRLYELLEVYQDKGYATVNGGGRAFYAKIISTIYPVYEPWSGSGSTPEGAIRVAVERAELSYILKAKYGQ